MWWLVGGVWAAAAELVVVDTGGALYARRGDTTPVHVVAQPVPMQVVSAAQGWLELSTHVDANPACGRLRDGNPALDLRVWVEEGDLARIVTRRVELSGDDGSRLVFHAGYQAPNPTGWSDAEAWRPVVAAWQSAIPEDAWGLRAAPDEGRADPPGWDQGIGRWDRVLEVRGVRHALPSVGISEASSTAWLGAGAVAPAEGGQVHLLFDQGCLEVTGAAPGLVAAPPLTGVDGMALAGLLGAPGGDRVAAGAALTWPDGEPAGVALVDLPLSGVRVEGRRACGVVSLTASGAVADPPVCAPVDAVQRPSPADVPSGSGEGAAGAIVMGALDRSLIAEVIGKQMSAIKYCYQRALQRTPRLNGSLTVRFTIAADGSVAQAGVKSSTLQHSELEQCVVQRFYHMTFPAPAGGGIVVVSYPFVFERGR